MGLGIGPFLLNLRGSGADIRERQIILLPVGRVEGWILDVLEMDLAQKLGCRVERHIPMDVPRDTLNPARGQYHSSHILQKAHDFLEPREQDIVLGIADVDLYTGGLNFVFGEAELGGQWAIISLTRLRQSFYSLPENKAIFSARTVKEAVHELGHVYGLEHCPDPECVMHFSNSLLDTDRKSASFCSRCQALWQALLKRLE
jgi:archaemetzincin